MTIEFTVPGRPVPMARPRVTMHGTYTPKRCRDYKSFVAMAAKAAMKGKKPMDGAICIDISVIYKPPKSWSKKKQETALMGELQPTSRPDLDNIYKAITDALIGIVYVDDAQITYATIGKCYRDVDEVYISVGGGLD